MKTRLIMKWMAPKDSFRAAQPQAALCRKDHQAERPLKDFVHPDSEAIWVSRKAKKFR